MALTDKQIVRAAKKLYEHGKHPDIMVQDDDVIHTDDGTGAWVVALVWVSKGTPPVHRNGRHYKNVTNDVTR